MNLELATLLKIVALAENCAGPYFNIVPKQVDYPCIAYYEISNTAERTKDPATYGFSTIEVNVFAKEGDINLQIGPADICYNVIEAIKTQLNGYLGKSGDKIIEIRWHNSEMDYNEASEIHIRRADFLIQHN